MITATINRYEAAREGVKVLTCRAAKDLQAQGAQVIYTDLGLYAQKGTITWINNPILDYVTIIYKEQENGCAETD